MKRIITSLLLIFTLCSCVCLCAAQNIDIVSEAKNKIYQYYGKNTFEEPEWIRVKNFLNWLDENNLSLNKYFWGKYHVSAGIDMDKYIFAFLGANYVSDNTISKMFDLPIKISRDGCYAYSYPAHICIEPYHYMEVLNAAIHEASHLLSAVGNSDIANNSYNMPQSDVLSEEITVFSQLKYALPLKSGKVLHGTKAYFIYSDLEKDRQKVKKIKEEYADIVYSVANYSDYNESKILNNKIRKSYSVYKILELIFNDINSNYLGNHILNDDEIYYLQSPVFQDTKKGMINLLSPVISNHYDYSKGYLQKVLSDNEDEILFLFIKNLRKYADKNIPPVPNGYI